MLGSLTNPAFIITEMLRSLFHDEVMRSLSNDNCSKCYEAPFFVFDSGIPSTRMVKVRCVYARLGLRVRDTCVCLNLTIRV